MDEETIDWVLSDKSIDPVSGSPLSAVVFMLYYGFELKYFFLELSDVLMTRYPLELYDVGRSSVYLGGSCGHGFFLNSNRISDLRDFDIVTILKKYDLRTECEYNKDEQTELHSSQQPEVGNERDREPEVENERDRDFCPSDNQMNVTCGSDTAYLNVEPSEQAGYILLHKCRRRSVSQVSLQQRYVSSSAVMKARFEYWNDAKMFIKQKYTGTSRTQQIFYESAYGPVLSFVDTQGPAVNAFLTDKGFPMTTTLNTDIVIALPYPGWPSQAREWLSRDIKYGWPSEALKQEIQNSIGCMLVPVGHFGSNMEDFQWRISFSRAEMLLSRSFTRVQRELVHLLKAFNIGGSYHMLNLMYRLVENTPADRWRSKSLASRLFTIVDQYIACIRERRLSHYFIPGMNLLSKYEQDFVVVNGRTRPIDEHIEAVLLPLYELRINPLDTILRQDKHLSLPEGIRLRVFAPFVDEMKSTGSQNKLVYIDTLVSLAKAHLHEGNVPSAYRYARDAINFSQRLNVDTAVERQMDLHLTAAMCSYRSGDTTSALTSLKLLEHLLNTDERDVGRVMDVRRSYFLMMYGRILTISFSLPLSQKSASLAIARKMYRDAMDTLVPVTTVYLDSINFFMRLGETDEVNTLITFLSAYLLPGDKCDVTRSSPGDNHGGVGPVGDGSEQQVRTNNNEAEIIKTSAQNPSNARDVHDDEDMHQSSATEHVAGIDRDERIEVVYDRDRHVTEEKPSSWTPIDAGSSQFTAIAGGMDYQEEPDTVTTIAGGMHYQEEPDTVTTFPEEINNLDAYFMHRIILAKKYEKIGMVEKSNEMLGKLKEKLEVDHGNAERLFPLVVEASKVYEKISYAHDRTPEGWDDVFKGNADYLIYCDADLPVVDDIIASVIRRKGGRMKVAHKEALLHFQIQHFKMLHEFARAESIVAILQCVCGDSVRDESRWLLQLHRAYFGHKTSDDMNEETKRKLGVDDEVVARIDQLMDVIKAHEIRNSAMDDLFNFSDY